VFASCGEALTVLEYSELDPAVASAADPEAADGTLMYNWANICMHFFSTEWLLKVCHADDGRETLSNVIIINQLHHPLMIPSCDLFLHHQVSKYLKDGTAYHVAKKTIPSKVTSRSQKKSDLYCFSQPCCWDFDVRGPHSPPRAIRVALFKASSWSCSSLTPSRSHSPGRWR